jgi:hypothetical protein
LNPNHAPEVHPPVKGEWAGFRDFDSFKPIHDRLGSKLTISLTVATILVTKPFIHAGLVEHDKETVKFWVAPASRGLVSASRRNLSPFAFVSLRERRRGDLTCKKNVSPR